MQVAQFHKGMREMQPGLKDELTGLLSLLDQLVDLVALLPNGISVVHRALAAAGQSEIVVEPCQFFGIQHAVLVIDFEHLIPSGFGG